MATKTFDELKQLAIQIRDEKTNKQNTANRVGASMLEAINKLEQDYYDKKITDTELAKIDKEILELGKQVDSQKNEVNEARDEAIAMFRSQRVTPDMLSESTIQLIESSGGGTIENLPDDEDLESVKNNLGINTIKLKNREYNPVNFSGKGYIILRKNIIGGKNILSQDNINKENTIYVIRYDFDLNTDIINIPTNCILQFEGGTLKNGTIHGNYTKVLNARESCFDEIIISGTYTNETVYSSWFKNNNKRSSFQNALNLSSDRTLTEVNFEKGEYYLDFTDDVYVNPALIIPYDNTVLNVYSSLKAQTNNLEYYCMILSLGKNNIIIDGHNIGELTGDVQTHTGESGEWGYGINILSGKNIVIKNISCNEFWGDGINLQGQGTQETQCENITIDNVICRYNRRQGMSIESCNSGVVRNSDFSYTGKYKKTSPGAGIDIEPYTLNNVAKEILIENCVAEGVGFLIAKTKNPEVKNITFKNCACNEMNIAQDEIKIIECNIKNYLLLRSGNNIVIENSVIGSEIMFEDDTDFVSNITLRKVDIITSDNSPSYSGMLIGAWGGTQQIQGITIEDCRFIDVFNKKSKILINTSGGKITNTTIILKGGILIAGIDSIKDCYINKDGKDNQPLEFISPASSIMDIKDTTFNSDKYRFTIPSDGSSINVYNCMLGSAFLTKFDTEYWIETNENANKLTIEKCYFGYDNNVSINVANKLKSKGVNIPSINGISNFYAEIGSTSDRPVLNEWDYGFQFYDNTIKKPIWWDGYKWIDSAGTSV